MDDFALLILALIVIALNVAGVCLDFSLNPIKRTVKYRLKRLSNWFVIGITYAFIYMGRYHLSVLNTDVYRSRLNISKDNLGWVFTLGFWAYAVSLPFTGYIIANMDGKKVLIVGSIGSGLMNLLVGLVYYIKGDSVSGFGLLVAFVVVNFTFQGLCTSAVPQLNSRWYKSREAGNFSGVFSVLTSTGYFMALNIGALIVASSKWWFFIFIVPASGLILWNIMVWLVVRAPPATSVRNPLHEELGYEKEKPSELNTVNIEMHDMSALADTPIAENVVGNLNENSPHTTPTASPNTSPPSSPHSSPHNMSPSMTPRDARPRIPREMRTAMHRNTTVVALSHQDDTEDDDEYDDTDYTQNDDVMMTSPPTPVVYSEVVPPPSQQIQQQQEKHLSVFRKIMILIWKNNQALGTIFFLGYAKESLLTWFPSFLEDVHNCPPDSTIYVVTSCGLTLASMFGAVIVGVISDKIFRSRRNPVYVLCALLYTLSFVVLPFAPNAVAACILLCFGGIWLLGSFSLVAFSAALDLNDKNTSTPPPTTTLSIPTLTTSTTTLTTPQQQRHTLIGGGVSTTTPTTINMSKPTAKKSSKSSSVTFFSCMLGLFQYVGSGLSGIVGAKVIGELGYTAWCFVLAGVCFASVMPVLLFSDTCIRYVKRAKAAVVGSV